MWTSFNTDDDDTYLTQSEFAAGLRSMYGVTLLPDSVTSCIFGKVDTTPAGNSHIVLPTTTCLRLSLSLSLSLSICASSNTQAWKGNHNYQRFDLQMHWFVCRGDILTPLPVACIPQHGTRLATKRSWSGGGSSDLCLGRILASVVIGAVEARHSSRRLTHQLKW
uniref:Uncharacterized protein n=1 Tax=Florenciella parvula TaxID=236787 RepID=A0A7S2BXJ5_9STRA|mmetsp:Transcript_21910/g.45649  ORF Transcript_21910/g.45649 Transcript_21910/m.45649 type:complete len:165 (+) Transcript_21910:255-749(+)